MSQRSVLLALLMLAVAAAAQEARQLDKEKAELEEYIKKKELEINHRFKLDYHVTPRVGWMNDPNGMSFFDGLYHLFYQFYPYDSIWGPMHWGHAASPDLVHWEHLPTALIPEDEMCFSGSAIQVNEYLLLLYTGRRTTTTLPFFNETQYLAYSTDGIDFRKYRGNPVLSYTPNNAADFRDPKVWKRGEHYYVVLGSKKDSDTGRALLYRSRDMLEWEFIRVLAESNGNLGYMWECPDFFELNGKYVLLFSPQGVEPKGDRYKNLYQTGYIIGDFDYETFEFVPTVQFQELDFGHDFYATQTMEKDGKRYVMGWFAMWEREFPEAADGWAGAMTLPRELRLIGNRLVQKPLFDMAKLREGAVASGTFLAGSTLNFVRTGELIIEPDLTKPVEILFEGSSGGGKATIRWNPGTGKISVDRGDGDIRQVEWVPIQSLTWHIFLDASSIELFCGEGEVVFSTRVYKLGNWKVINMSQHNMRTDAYRLKRSVSG